MKKIIIFLINIILLILRNNGAYLAEAAYHISLAQDEAVSSNPERALNEYNKAITTLIKGVQCLFLLILVCFILIKTTKVYI